MKQDTLARLKYLPHIDGLRAFAVIAVILFHIAPDIFPGGYLGVDIFFVISGYVISQSLYKSYLQNNRINLKDFYIRRFKRLYPALLTMVSLTSFLYFLVGFLWDTNLFIKSSFSSIFAFSNLYYFKIGDDYFHQGLVNPLLHTWSLGVEEQFYLFYPIILLIALPYLLKSKFKETLVGCFFLLMTIFLYLVFITNEENFLGNFYSPIARFWELTAGCSLFFLSLKFNLKLKWTKIVYLGMGCILFTILLQSLINNIHVETLLVVLGTSMMIASGLQADSALIRFLKIRPMLFVGSLSYSLYLWHFPVIYFLSLYLDKFLYFLLSVPTMFALAYLSFNFIESKFRSSDWLDRNYLFLLKTASFFAGLLIAVILLTGLSNVSFNVNKKLNQFSDFISGINYLENKADLSSRIEPQYSFKNTDVIKYCHNVDYAKSQSLVIDQCFKKNLHNELLYLTGDSHALHFLPMIDNAGIPNDIYFEEYPRNQILNKNITSLKNLGFSKYREEQLKKLSLDYEKIILVTSFFVNSEPQVDQSLIYKFEEYIQRYSPYATIVFIAPTPVFEVGPVSCVAVGIHCSIEAAKDKQRNQESLNMLMDLSNRYENVYIYNPYDELCPGDFCNIYDEEHDFLLYRDDDHLSVEASVKLARTLRNGLITTHGKSNFI